MRAQRAGVRAISGVGGPSGTHHVGAVTEGEVAQRAFNREAELFVKPDGRRVVGVHRKFDAPQRQPVIGQVERRRQQRAADTLP